MSIDDLNDTSRVFVSGLPAGYTSKQLRVLFSDKFTVTDAHVLSDRRIGFVGLADHQTAKDAVRYFNRSFIRMSKISVGLAQPVEVKANAQGQVAPVSQRARRGHSSNQPISQRPQKRKRDQDDEGESLREKTSLSTNPRQNPEGSSGALPYLGHSEHGMPAAKDQQDSTEAAMPDSNIAQPAVASDSDWLRAKTSRVLDLQDENIEPTESKPLDEAAPMLERSDEEQDVKQAGESRESSDKKPTLQISTSRLFLRNLAFDVSEGDLRNLLSAYGQLSEVSKPSFSLPTSHDAFLIGTSYALHMILNRRET
jgi:multiple RNA-binding domain-containing protein 1